MNRILKTVCVAVLAHAAAAGDLPANPNHQQLDAAMAVHGKEFSAELHKRAMDFYEPAKRKLFDFLEKEAKGDIDRIRAEDLGDAYVLVTRLRRAADHLQLLGEPAGRDFDLRAAEMHEHLGRLIEKSKPVPATQKYIDSFRQFIAKSEAARAKAVVELRKLITQRKWEQAEADLFKVYDRLQQGTVFLSMPENQVIYTPFSEPESVIRPAMSEIRATKAKELLEKAIVELTPKYPALIDEAKAALASLSGSGSGTWRGETVTGPQLIEKLAQLWRETQVGALQARAKYWALMHRRNPFGMSAAAISGIGTGPADEKFATDYAAFSTEIVKAIGGVIEAEAARAEPSTLPATYASYLRALAPITRESNNPQFVAAFQGSLAKLAARDAAFQQQVAAYDAATSDLLRWRAKAASSRAVRMTSEFAPIEKRFHEGTVSDDQYIGLFSPTATDLPQLNAPAPDVMKTAVERLMGKKVIVRDAIRLPGESKAAIARYFNRTYANVPLAWDVAGEVNALKEDLLVSDQAPPLTLAAMQSLTTAERGDMVAIGGTIAGTHLEGVITRFGALPVSAAILTTLGSLPAERIEGSGLSHMLMRFNVTPSWVMHEHFFATVAPATELTSR